MILSKRPFTSGANYRKIWNTETDESPLRTITREQTAALAARLAERHGDRLVVDFAMRYGNPSTASVIERLQAAGCERILFFPLYPQYSATTTATANDEAFRALMRLRWQPAIRTVPAYHDHPLYIEALARSVEEAYAGLAERPDVLLTSYHGMPERYLAEGDPYYCHCHKTTRLLRDRLGPDFGEVVVSLPVPLRQGGVAEALHRRGGRPPGAGRAGAASRSWRRSSPPTASRRSRRSARRSASPSSPPAARRSPTSPA